MSYLSDFLDAYVDCALWSSTGGDDRPLDADHSDVSTEARNKMRLDCADFLTLTRDDLEGMDPAQAGHDFWLTRNGHGAGFWDRGLGERGERLTKAAKTFGESYLYVGDDGAVYS